MKCSADATLALPRVRVRRWCRARRGRATPRSCTRWRCSRRTRRRCANAALLACNAGSDCQLFFRSRCSGSSRRFGGRLPLQMPLLPRRRLRKPPPPQRSARRRRSSLPRLLRRRLCRCLCRRSASPLLRPRRGATPPTMKRCCPCAHGRASGGSSGAGSWCVSRALFDERICFTFSSNCIARLLAGCAPGVGPPGRRRARAALRLAARGAALRAPTGALATS